MGDKKKRKGIKKRKAKRKRKQEKRKIKKGKKKGKEGKEERGKKERKSINMSVLGKLSWSQHALLFHLMKFSLVVLFVTSQMPWLWWSPAGQEYKSYSIVFPVYHSKASLVSSDRPTDVCRFKGQIMVVVKEGWSGSFNTDHMCILIDCWILGYRYIHVAST